MTRRFGKYEILDECGVGSVARVYSARDGDSVVALKIYESLKYAHDSADLRRSFQHELDMVRTLDHPGIVRVIDSGVIDDTPYIAMELLEGGSLEQRVGSRGAMEIDETLRIVEQLAGALAHAHEKNILHRDIKPSNILFDRTDRAVLADFGVAKWIQPAERATTSASALEPGTSDFMAPEVLQDAPTSRSSDQYSLALTVYYALCGALPTEGKTVFSRCRDRITGDLIPLCRRNPVVSKELSDALMVALAVAPTDRYDSVLNFSRALSLAAAGRPVAGSPGSEPTEPAPTPSSGDPEDSGSAFRYWRYVIVPIAVAALGVAGIFLEKLLGD